MWISGGTRDVDQMDKGQILATLFSCCVTLGKFLKFSVPSLLTYTLRTIMVVQIISIILFKNTRLVLAHIKYHIHLVSYWFLKNQDSNTIYLFVVRIR